MVTSLRKWRVDKIINKNPTTETVVGVWYDFSNSVEFVMFSIREVIKLLTSAALNTCGGTRAYFSTCSLFKNRKKFKTQRRFSWHHVHKQEQQRLHFYLR